MFRGGILFILAIVAPVIAVGPNSDSSHRAAPSSVIKQGHPANENKSSANQNGNAHRRPVAVKAIASSKGTSDAGQSTNDRHKEILDGRIAFWTEVSAVSATLLFFAAVGQLFLFWWQLGLIKRTLKDAESASKTATIAANAAQSQASTLDATLELSKNTAINELRAYIEINAVGINLVYAGQIASGKISYTNSGRTPARNVVSWHRMTVAPDPLNVDLPLEDTTGTPPSKTTLGSGATHFMPFKLTNPLTVEGETAIRNGTGGMYVWGQITYWDVFNQERHTKFRLVYRNSSGDPMQSAMDVCPEGNESD